MCLNEHEGWVAGPMLSFRTSESEDANMKFDGGVSSQQDGPAQSRHMIIRMRTPEFDVRCVAYAVHKRVI